MNNGPAHAAEEASLQPIRLEIVDLGAAGALEGVENALRTVPGVMSVRADPRGEGVHVEAADSIDPDDLVAAVQKAGYIATLAG
jgi:copper chaperone CopZ